MSFYSLRVRTILIVSALLACLARSFGKLRVTRTIIAIRRSASAGPKQVHVSEPDSEQIRAYNNLNLQNVQSFRTLKENS